MSVTLKGVKHTNINPENIFDGRVHSMLFFSSKNLRSFLEKKNCP